MKQIIISDVTLRENEYSFKEKIEIAKQLNKLNVNVIELFKIENRKTDILFLHTIAPLMNKSTIACEIGLDDSLIEVTNEALSGCANYRLQVPIPVSTVQMEYMCHKKPKMVIELISDLVSKCKKYTDNVEFLALDATRSEFEFLCLAINTAILAGAKIITVCDSAGTMLPTEFERFIESLYEKIPALRDCVLGVSCSNELNMANACAIAAISAGAQEIKTVVNSDAYPSLGAISHIILSRGDSMGVSCDINGTSINRSIEKMLLLNDNKKSGHLTSSPTGVGEKIELNTGDDIKSVALAVKQLGYDLSDEDVSKVYDEFCRVATNKQIGAKELDAIIASVALQVPPTYKLDCFVINNGNKIAATAQVTLTKDEEKLMGVAMGDGPVDAAFLAIEQIAGTHFELDDFQIQAITEGQEAVASAVVKIRSNGKLYSGRGISQDIVGAGIYAYINAVNKICFEEE